jgi:hypothetical protein
VVVPRLEKDVPNQPTADELEADSLLHRFTVVFDREGYSPNFFLKMKQRRIACLTYHKYPGDDWPEDEFFPTKVRFASGEETTIRLVEQAILLGNQLWVREFRKLSESGHQTAVLSTDFKSPAARLAPAMFARWSRVESTTGAVADDMGSCRCPACAGASFHISAPSPAAAHRTVRADFPHTALGQDLMLSPTEGCACWAQDA